MKVIIVGGVAGGASCAARLRRLDEHAEIVMVERGPYVSFANCGLPYHVGGVIEHESDLLVASPQLFRGHFRVDCRTGCEAIGISAAEKTVQLRDVASGEVSTESYDKLVLSPGAASIRPPLPGIDLPGIFPVRTVPDAREIRQWIERGTSFLAGMGKYSGFQTVRPPMRAVVVGGGFIGLETAENLVHRGFEVTVVEMADQVLLPLDAEYGRLLSDFLEQRGVHVALNDGVAGFEQSENETLIVSTQCYAPPFGSAKDPINFAGMVGAGVLRGDMPLSHWDTAEDGFLLDVREHVELAVEHVAEAVNIPLGELRTRLDELPRDRPIRVVCRSGQRAYYATRILLQEGFNASVVAGGMLSHAILAPVAGVSSTEVPA
ncbi:MAG: FAD-dependent oxidoreductase [Solirubrobacteraceae bacterium]